VEFCETFKTVFSLDDDEDGMQHDGGGDGEVFDGADLLHISQDSLLLHGAGDDDSISIIDINLAAIDKVFYFLLLRSHGSSLLFVCCIICRFDNWESSNTASVRCKEGVVFYGFHSRDVKVMMMFNMTPSHCSFDWSSASVVKVRHIVLYAGPLPP